MKHIRIVLLSASLLSTAAGQPPPAARVVDLKASDGTLLKATYFSAAKPGPGVLLLHQFNRTRKAWDDLARQLAAAGINTLTFDMRGYGESGGKPHEKLSPEEGAKARERRPSDVDTAFRYLVSQPGVQRDVIGMGGAGALGVDYSAREAHLHSTEVKSLVFLSGETLRPELEFLHHAPQLPGLFVVADDDEFPPTVEAMELLYLTSSSPGKKFVHYPAAREAPWTWYEADDISHPVPSHGSHGTDLFQAHPELPGIIVDWFVTTLIKTPGHAPADTLATAEVLDRLQSPGGVAQVSAQLMEARRTDPGAQLFPEVTVSIIGQDHLRESEPKLAVDILKLLLLAYPWSADANETLSEAYLADGQKDLARQYAEKALALLDSHASPASSWTDTEQYRGEIRSGAQDVLKKIGQNETPPPTIASTVDREISAIEKQVVEAAQAMPEDKFYFSPESLNIPGGGYKGVRTFAFQVRHIAASNYAIWWRLTGDKFPDDYMGGDGPEKFKTKAEIIQFVKDSFALGHKAAATLTIENMLQPPEGSKSTRLRLAVFGAEHALDHYGQMVEYLRMNGIVPPASR